MSDKIKTISLKDFVEQGFLQELNRGFLHPHGLALAIEVNDEKTEYIFKEIWDYRDDPEGMAFGDLSDDESKEKADRVYAELEKHREARIQLFGQLIQPIGSKL